MTASPMVGVLGATGAVGAALARVLGGPGVRSRVRLGVRALSRLGPCAVDGVASGDAEVIVVDATDPVSLARFCHGCQVVVNGTGALTDRLVVAAAARASGAHYVDPGGDERQRHVLTDLFDGAGPAAVVGAGAMPGLSGLMARWLVAEHVGSPRTLEVFVSTVDRMAPASAREFLLSLVERAGAPSAAWQDGGRVRSAPLDLVDVMPPFLAGPLTAYPFVNDEIERLARTLSLRHAGGYHLFEPGSRVLTALSRLQMGLAQATDVTELAAELSRAADLDLFGRRSCQLIVVEVGGHRASTEAAAGDRADPLVHRVAVVRASGTYELTAAVSAGAVTALLAGDVAAGAHVAADVLDPGLVGELPGQPGIVGLHVFEGPLAARASAEVGAI